MKKSNKQSYFLPDTILVALSVYFLNRRRHDFSRVVHEVDWNKPVIEWNKQKDLEYIQKASNGSYRAATAGTFFFKVNGKFIKITEETFPFGREVKKDHFFD